MLKPLAVLAGIHYGKSPAAVLTEESEIPVVGTGGAYCLASRPLFSGPAIVVPRKGSLGNPSYLSGPFWASDTTYAVLAYRGIDTKWLYYSLANFDLSRLNEATGVPSISRDWLRRIEFRVPAQPEQEHIAEILTTLDRTIEQTQALIEKFERITEGLLHQLLSQGVSSNGSLRPSRDEAPHLYKETRLGWIPIGWEIKELRMLADVSRGKFTVRPRNDPRFYGGDYPFIQTGDVALARGRILTDFGQTLNGKGLSVSKMFPVGTIMVTIAANIADTCILGVPMCAPDSLVGVTPKAGENARFIELSIRSKKRWLEGRAPQTAQRNINLEDLRPLLIASPDRPEQAAIAARYMAADSSLESIERELVKLQLQKAGLMHDLFSGGVSVNGLTT